MNGERIFVPELLIELQKLYQMEIIDTKEKNELTLGLKRLLQNEDVLNELKEKFLLLRRLNYEEAGEKALTKCISLIKKMEEY